MNQTYFAYHNSILKCVGGGDKRGKRIVGEEDSLSSRFSIGSKVAPLLWLWTKVPYPVILYSSQHNGHPCLFADVGGGAVRELG